MKKISIPAVVVGAILDIVSTTVLAIPLTLYEVHRWHLLGLPPGQGQEAVRVAYAGDIVWQLAGLAIGGFCSIFAGFIAGRIAKHNEMLNGSLTCILCLLIGIVGRMRSGTMTPTWFHVITFFLAPALGALGGYLSMKGKKRTVY
jgi:hypothetical protein